MRSSSGSSLKKISAHSASPSIKQVAVSTHAMEELREADVLWPDTGHGDEAGGEAKSWRRVAGGSAQRKASRPVSIPSARANNKRDSKSVSFGNYGDDEGGNVAGEMVIPPHVIVARRTTAEMTVFSACAGSGRTVKSRDLKRLRDSVLRMTGFLETS